jgi:hypothetical protein
VLLAACLLLGGCSSGNNEWRLYLQALRQGLGNSFRKQSVTREQAAAIPYASLGFRVNGGNESILVLATDNGEEQIWTAASHVVLTTRNGRIARTVGLPHDLAASVPQGTTSSAPLTAALKAPLRSSRAIDLPDIGFYGVTLNCIATARGRQAISIIGATIATVRVDETCQSANPRWSFTDNYWLDADTGFVWHAVQHVDPSTVVQIEILRPPG